MPDIIEQMISCPSVKQFCKDIHSYNIDNAAKMIGIDIKDAQLKRIKLYTELTEIPNVSVISNMLYPTEIDAFNEYMPWWDSTRASGLAFGVKTDIYNIPTKYFHIKFKPTYTNILYYNQFNFIKYLGIDFNSLLKGISYDNEKSKFYLYVNDKRDITRILKYKKIDNNVDVGLIEELEIYATEDSFKINIINNINNYSTKQNIKNIIPKNCLEIVSKIEYLVKSPPIYNGISTNNIYSVYYSLTNKENIYDLLYNNSQ